MICSFTPMLKLPRPSNERAETPRKSRTRGSDTFTRRSRNSYILERRRVTLQPIGQPSRILKDATETRDSVTIDRTRHVSGTRVSVRVDLGWRRLIKQ